MQAALSGVPGMQVTCVHTPVVCIRALAWLNVSGMATDAAAKQMKLKSFSAASCILGC